MSRVLITGSCSFLASHLIPLLLAANHEVDGIDLHHPESRETWRMEAFRKHRAFRYRWGNMAEGGVSRVAVTNNAIWVPDVVIHIGAVTDVRWSLANPSYTLLTNTQDTVAVMQQCLHFDPRPHFIYVSTHSVYGGGHTQPIAEDVPLHPSTFYGATKAASEALVTAFGAEQGLPYTTVRPALMYGERERPGSLVTNFLGRAMRSETITLDGGGWQARDMVYGGDVARFIALITKPGLHYRTLGQVFNAGSGRAIAIRDLAQWCIDHFRRGQIAEGPQRAGEEGVFYLDNNKAQKLGWRPEVLFEDGLKLTADWVETQ